MRKLKNLAASQGLGSEGVAEMKKIEKIFPTHLQKSFGRKSIIKLDFNENEKEQQQIRKFKDFMLTDVRDLNRVNFNRLRQQVLQSGTTTPANDNHWRAKAPAPILTSQVNVSGNLSPTNFDDTNLNIQNISHEASPVRASSKPKVLVRQMTTVIKDNKKTRQDRDIKRYIQAEIADLSFRKFEKVPETVANAVETRMHEQDHLNKVFEEFKVNPRKISKTRNRKRHRSQTRMVNSLNQSMKLSKENTGEFRTMFKNVNYSNRNVNNLKSGGSGQSATFSTN